MNEIQEARITWPARTFREQAEAIGYEWPEDRHAARHVEGTCDGCPLCCCDHPDHAELWKGQCPDCKWRAVQEAKK